ncbi:MAG: N-acetylmuramoyl-L-alanine amidase [Alkalibacterium sp.]|nr:N-acetylmuramoyl-L-alanine amidase [Alkalibacterium sp.]
MKRLIIDPGHGGTDPGATAFGQKEKDWTLKMSLYQYKRFKELGVNVEMTRYEDSTLNPVARISRVKNRADICISNHFNAFNGSARGVEVIHSIHASPRFSQIVADNLVRQTGLPFRRVFSRSLPNKKHDYYFMHRLTGSTQTLIIEYGFIDHPLDNQYFKHDSQFLRAAEAVIESVCIELGVTYLAKQVTTQVPSLQVVQKKTLRNEDKKESDSKRNSYVGKILQSVHKGQLRFYSRPSWKDEDVFGYMTEGQVFPLINKKVRVGKGDQYQVQNRRGEVYYVTAHPEFVLVK